MAGGWQAAAVGTPQQGGPRPHLRHVEPRYVGDQQGDLQAWREWSRHAWGRSTHQPVGCARLAATPLQGNFLPASRPGMQQAVPAAPPCPRGRPAVRLWQWTGCTASRRLRHSSVGVGGVSDSGSGSQMAGAGGLSGPALSRWAPASAWALCFPCSLYTRIAVAGGDPPGTRDHSRLPRVFRQLLPTAFLATTAAIRRPSCTVGAEHWVRAMHG